ncbi:MAG TPA: thioredoxin family protein [Candidatus Paceibacterota bacterium]|nr:thioredoxin family protein [Candidatus Paceibacterota bacterium]
MDPVVNTHGARWGSYIVAFFITSLIFATALYASNYFNNQRIADIRATQDDISTQILSTETQFDLLEQHSCSDVAENTVLPSSMTSLGSELSYLESQGGNQAEIQRLKGMYSLLEIKDYLIMQQLAERCNLKPVFILYFYSNKGDCPQCEAQGDILTQLSATYPQLRVYSFDYNLPVGALQTLISINNVDGSLPALVINHKVYYGFQSMASIQKILPQLKTLQTASSSPATK